LIELEKKDYKGSPFNQNARGEIIIRNDDFKNLYPTIIKKDGKPYKNQRNAVAGIVGLKDIKEIQMQGAKLTLIDYETYGKILTFSQLKDPSIWNKVVEELSSLPYPMDGIVIKLKDDNYAERLGYTAHHPRGHIAFKFSGARAVSVIKNIEWSFGKKSLTPLAIIEPVEINGITIKKLSLHNYKFIVDNDIQIGDKIIVERAGDVIPHVISTEPGIERKSPLIEFCPSCSQKLSIDGPELICLNPECPEIQIQLLLSAVRSIGIERLGEPTLRKMRDTLGVKCLSDIFSLTKEQISKLEGFKSKSSENLYNEIQNARNTTDYALLASLNIPGIGKNIAKSILLKYTLDDLRKMTIEDLEKIPGIGPERAKDLYSNLKENSELIDELSKTLNIEQSKGKNISKKTICFTGKMPMPRTYYEKLARDSSYLPVDSVTETLTLLVAMDPSENSSKLQKAKKYSIKVLSLDEWLKSIEADKSQENQSKNHNSDFLPGFG
ncbi:MAG TPA: helix-hairpin-helix domain-containing protein, partial [Victivallales bacterium]|nr:helix-hairpin-helix domain-containing protein [Victivallales bacterium]